ncbi:MAG: tetratricopeptide repeat protein [Alphaproteobacteria bacterium]|nr:MAG: tetratricopeptide repeat protein [Alphaproteobacteria bacterium]
MSVWCRKLRVGLTFLTGYWVVTVGSVAETQAPTINLPEQLSICSEPSRPFSERIVACQAVIESGNSTSQEKSKAYSGRGTLTSDPFNSKDPLLDFERALGLDPSNAGAYVGRGNLHYLIGFSQNLPDEIRLSISDYDKAIGLQGDDAHLYSSRGSSYFALGEFEHALSDASRAADLIPEWPPYRYANGMAHIRLKNYEHAVREFSKAIELQNLSNESGFSARLKLGRYQSALGDAHFVKGDYSAAITAYDKALGGVRVVDEHQIFRYLAAVKLGRSDASDVLRKQISRETPERNISVFWGRLFTNEVTPGEVLDAIKPEGAHSDTLGRCLGHYYLGAYYEMAGDPKRAVFHYGQSVETEAFVVIQYMLAEATLDRLMQANN